MIPDKVKIGPFTYTVSLTDGPIIVDNRACKGAITYSSLTIELLDDAADERKLHTLFHEITHGIIDERNLEINETKPELLVDELAHGFMRFIQDNKEWVKSLCEE